jgi:GTPase SAR1 family protein
MAQEHYTLIKNSKNSDDVPIAIIKDGSNTVIDMHKSQHKTKITSEINSEADVWPIFHRPKQQNIRIYIAGQSGVGKSYLTAKILENYVKVYTTQRIIIFSALEDDPAYDKNPKLMNKIQRIMVDDANIAELSQIKEEQLANSLVLFDDFYSSNKLGKVINDLKNTVLRRGRHYDTDVIVISDNLLDQ